MIYDWTARIVLAAAFGLLILLNLQHFTLSRVASVMFLTLLIALTLTRMTAIRKADGIAPRAMALCGTFGILMMSALPHHSGAVLEFVASSFIVLGSLAALFTLAWLGRSFSICPEARKLVTDGPYGFSRHPLYICEELAVFGVFLTVVSPVAFVILLTHAACQFRRMLHEERVLAATFPEYKFYARRVPRLI